MSREPFFLSSCSGPCDQGRRECQCPEACRQPEPEPLTKREGFTFWFLPVVALLAGAGVGVYWIFK